MREPRPATPAEAVARVRALLETPENALAGYVLGGGGYQPTWHTPWTGHGPNFGGDCRVPFLWGYMLPAERPGYNRQPWATVADDINYNSLLEDAEHEQDLVVPALGTPLEGDIVAYPTLHITTHEDGVATEHTFIGHGALVVGVSRVKGWDPAAPVFAMLDIIQVCGGPGRKPAAIASSAAHFDVARPVAKWPKPEHRPRLLRVKP